MMNNTNNGKQVWMFQHDSGSVTEGYATDARGLRLRAECGYTHVKMAGTSNDGWLQISVAIRKLDMAERLAKLAA